MVLPTRIAAQTILAFGARIVPPFIKNPADNWFSEGIHPRFVGCQDLSTLDERGINPVSFCDHL